MNKKLALLLCSLIIVGIFAQIISIVSASKPDGVPRVLEKRVFIHYRRGYGRPPGVGGGKPGGDGHSDHYALLGRGVEWKGTAILFVDPEGSGMDPETVVLIIEISAEEWDDGAYSGWGGVQVNLFDGYTQVNDGSFDDELEELDERNELLFGEYSDPNVIAVTVIWGYFSGPPRWREIVEFDILFNTDFSWGDADVDDDGTVDNVGVMDLQSIATHELGHGAGLDDTYSCELETMYGYASYGEITKRDLYTGDKAGIQDLYG